MTYSLHSGAEQDIVDALNFYIEQEGLLVAQRFLSEFEHAVQLWSSIHILENRARMVGEFFRCEFSRT